MLHVGVNQVVFIHFACDGALLEKVVELLLVEDWLNPVLLPEHLLGVLELQFPSLVLCEFGFLAAMAEIILIVTIIFQLPSFSEDYWFVFNAFKQIDASLNVLLCNLKFFNPRDKILVLHPLWLGYIRVMGLSLSFEVVNEVDCIPHVFQVIGEVPSRLSCFQDFPSEVHRLHLSHDRSEGRVEVVFQVSIIPSWNVF